MPIRRDLNNRISFYDPSNQGTLDRLLSGDVVLQLEKEGDDGEGGDAQLENAQATLTSVEEMLEGYEMASDDILGGKTMKGTADQIEARLLDELMALEKVGGQCGNVSRRCDLTVSGRPISTLSSKRMIGSMSSSNIWTKPSQSWIQWTASSRPTRSI